MEEFFKSTKFRILGGLAVVVLAFMLHAAVDDTRIPLISGLVGTVTGPLQKLSASVTNSVGGALSNLVHASELARENRELKLQIDELNQKLAEFDQYKSENEHLKEFLEIKEKNPDFSFESAMVTARDPNDTFYSFTIDKGTLDDIAVGDPVITSGGLVGIVSEVGSYHAKVSTILDATISVGAMDTATREIGSLGGTVGLALEGKCKLSYLPRETSASVGDLVTTTGAGGVYPSGLMLGKIESIQPESHGLSYYAVVVPAFDVRTVKDVLVITHFEGQAAS